VEEGAPDIHLGRALWKRKEVCFACTLIRFDDAFSFFSLFEVSLETQFGSGTFNKVMSTSNLDLPPSGYYFGVSASTGELTDFHRIKEFYATGYAAAAVFFFFFFFFNMNAYSAALRRK
jgi:hypothetical protein